MNSLASNENNNPEGENATLHHPFVTQLSGLINDYVVEFGEVPYLLGVDPVMGTMFAMGKDVYNEIAPHLVELLESIRKYVLDDVFECVIEN